MTQKINKAPQNQDRILSGLLRDLRSEAYALSGQGANIAIVVKWKGKTWELDTDAAWTPKLDDAAQQPESDMDGNEESVMPESLVFNSASPNLPPQPLMSQTLVESSAPMSDPNVRESHTSCLPPLHPEMSQIA
ncbi:hypothetical protein TruAng_012312 [Truncatella angustata]|nr:hypothetical protein TruAng_012312 [Truncatella angustata]